MEGRRFDSATALVSRIWPFWMLAVFLASAGTVPAGPVVSVELESAEAAEDFVVTFAHPFVEGHITESLVLTAGDKELTTQLDVKRRYPDGSVRHAVISALVPAVQPGKPLKLDVRPAPPSRSDVSVPDIPANFSAEIRFSLPTGRRLTADAGDILRNASAGTQGYRIITWLSGPLVKEIQLAGPPRAEDGSPQPDLLTIFGLRIAEPERSMRIETVVELPWPDVPGNIPYDAEILFGGRVLADLERVGYWQHDMPYWLKDKDRNLGHFAHSRWRKLFSMGRRHPDIHVRYDPSYLVSTALLPPYDTRLTVAAKAIENNVARWNSSHRNILENGIIMAYFPTTGGREDLGPYPAWTTRYLLSGDSRLWPVVLGTGDLAGSFPVHIRDRRSMGILSIDDHSGYSLNPRGTLEKITPRPADANTIVMPATSPYEVDNAHQPSLAFVPYLLTGEFYYLEEIYFWANWCMLIQNAAYRQKDKGLVTPDQVRGQAWALRQLVDAAKIAPDEHLEKAYFDSKVANNLDYYLAFIEGPDATPLGTYTAGASDAYVRGRPDSERRKWLTLAPWQQNFLAWSLDHAARAGYGRAAAARDHFTRLQVGLLTNPQEYHPDYAAPYFLVVGERQQDRLSYYTTWRDLFEKTFKVVAPDSEGDIDRLDYPDSYAYIARAVLVNAVRNDVAGAGEALGLLEAHLTRRTENLAENPAWAFDRR